MKVKHSTLHSEYHSISPKNIKCITSTNTNLEKNNINNYVNLRQSISDTPASNYSTTIPDNLNRFDTSNTPPSAVRSERFNE